MIYVTIVFSFFKKQKKEKRIKHHKKLIDKRDKVDAIIHHKSAQYAQSHPAIE